MVELRREVTPVGAFRLPRRTGMDGMLRRRGGVLERLLHHDDEPVLVRVAQTSPETVLFGAWAPTNAAAEYGIERMRFALGVDDDLGAFLREFARDPLIGRSVRARPWLRAVRRPEPFESLAWAICEQLIEYTRAAAIERRIVRRLGPSLESANAATLRRAARRANETAQRAVGDQPLRDVPSAEVLAGTAPALLESFDLSPGRALALRRAAREVASGRVDLYGGDHEHAWGRLRALPGIGSWTVECLALHGQGRMDQVPAGDLGLRKLVGRLRSGGDPKARAEEAEVREFFAPYAPWAGLAATYALRL